MADTLPLPDDNTSSLFPTENSENVSSYYVTARKYRPQTFGEMVGQAHVARTLGNAIRMDRLAHAYLFSGPRGVGKTTAARILAKAVNCTTPLEERENAEPCRECDSCKALEAGRSMNIIEIDAASNNGVDDIRDLRDTVRIPPQGAKKKIYILDEVHMLSKGAFNALLKTLEEPPSHVLFIFATTEPHKVLPTILSRTQRFDFRRITVPEIVGRLKHICTEENISADEEALLLLARKGDGALRDALSLLDQAVSLCGESLTGNDLREALGVVETDRFFEVTDKAKARDRAGLLSIVDGLVRSGYDLTEFLNGLAEHIRHLLVAASTGKADLIEETSATQERYMAVCRDFAEADLLHLLMMVDEAASSIRMSRNPRLSVELALLKMASLEPAENLERLLAQLEKHRSTPETSHSVAAEPEPTYSASRTEEAKEETAQPEPVPKSSGPSSPPGENTPPPSSPPQEPAPTPKQSPGSSGPAHGGLFGSPALTKIKKKPDDSPSASFSGGDGSAAIAEPELMEAEGSQVTDDFSVPFAKIKSLWSDLVDTITAERVHVGSLLQQAAPHRVSGGSIEVAVPDAFSKRLLESELTSFKDVLTSLLDAEPPPLRFVVHRQNGGNQNEEVDPYERLKQLRHENPVLQALFEKF
ncbi:MAG: DNA polymerase III subunit gamma/tau, partial [Rubricoccaceae bacterium]|nr:DNA polymerase III subunit gamma/tau [Rubricoccaceae bacterium]